MRENYDDQQQYDDSQYEDWTSDAYYGQEGYYGEDYDCDDGEEYEEEESEDVEGDNKHHSLIKKLWCAESQATSTWPVGHPFVHQQ